MTRWVTGGLAVAITLGAVLWSMGIYQILALELYAEQFSAAMLAVGLALAFLHLPARRHAPMPRKPKAPTCEDCYFRKNMLCALQEEEQQSGVILTAAQQAEIESFRGEMITLRQELRAVQRSLREDVERLATWIKVVNIWAVPVLIALLAIAVALVRRARTARAASSAT